MSVYPVLEIESLKKRCSQDITQFLREQNITTNPVEYVSLESGTTFDAFKSSIDDKLNLKFKDDANYVDIISELSTEEQQKKWILRTYLVYQLLIILTLSLTNHDLYDSVFDKIKLISLEFRDDVPYRLEYIKLGIFGSLTPTSDIDIGFQYSGQSDGYTPCLAYVVSRFELLFKIFTGKTCLDYDVESYADMITVPNPDESSKAEFPDLFYIDSSKLDWNNEETKRGLLPIAFNSIVRNAMIAKVPDKDITLKNVLFPFKENTIPENTIPEITIPKITIPKITSDIVSTLSIDTVAIAAFETSKATVSAFLGMGYEQQIQAYYDKVVFAETLKVNLLKDKKTTEDLQKLTYCDIMSLMKAIGDALTLRMESYTCSPTVVHVVRLLQAAQKIAQQAAQKLAQLAAAKKTQGAQQAQGAANRFLEKFKPSSPSSISGKYVTTTPAELCDTKKLQTAKCVVGLTGFILSALEQLGYMYRFHKVYCADDDSHKNPDKCNKKIDKYKNRLVHANGNIDTLQKLQAQAKPGGARRKRSKKIFTRKRVYKRTNKYRRRHYKTKTAHNNAHKKSVRKV